MSQKDLWSWKKISLIVVILIVIGVVGFFAMDHVSRTNPNFCALCHNMQDHVHSYLDSNHLDNVHFKAKVGCKECHSNYSVIDEAKDGIRFILHRYEEPMDEIEFPQEECLKCHESWDSLAKRTAALDPNPHKSHLGEPECTMCHKSHKPSEVYCNQCHKTQLHL